MTVRSAPLQFIGPLTAEQQRWADRMMATDTAAALVEPLTGVLLRREGQVAASFADAALLFQAADDAAWPAVYRAIAEARALVWLAASDPAGCWDCLLSDAPCERHRRLNERRSRLPHDRRPAEHEWRRFGSDAT